MYLRDHEDPPSMVAVLGPAPGGGMGVGAAARAGSPDPPRAADLDGATGTPPPLLVAVLGVEPGTVLPCVHCRAGGVADRVWDELAWVAGRPDDLAARLAAAAIAGTLRSWAVLVPGVQRSFVRRTDGGTGSRPRLDRPAARVSLHGPPAGMSDADYRARFLEHCAVTEEHMRLARAYRQTEVELQLGPPGRSVHGISEFWFTTADEAAHMYADEHEAQAVGEHARTFVDVTGAVTVRGIAADGSR